MQLVKHCVCAALDWQSHLVTIASKCLAGTVDAHPPLVTATTMTE
jgi:hypothetical protein